MDVVSVGGGAHPSGRRVGVCNEGRLIGSADRPSARRSQADAEYHRLQRRRSGGILDDPPDHGSAEAPEAYENYDLCRTIDLERPESERKGGGDGDRRRHREDHDGQREECRDDHGDEKTTGEI